MDYFSQRLRPAALGVALTAATLSGCTSVPSFPTSPVQGTSAPTARVESVKREPSRKRSIIQTVPITPGANAPGRQIADGKPAAGTSPDFLGITPRPVVASTNRKPAPSLPKTSNGTKRPVSVIAATGARTHRPSATKPLDEGSSPATEEIQQTAYADGEVPPPPSSTPSEPEVIGKRKPGPSLSQRLKIPPELPGAEAPPITLPSLDSTGTETRAAAIDRLFPKLPAMAEKVGPQAGETPWTLAQFEQFAMENNPILVQSTADIDAAAGNAYQAGMYPNPVIGYEADTVNSGGTLNYQGVFIEQTIKTAGKLELARLSGQMDTLNAQLALRKSRINVLTKVRANYYGVLVAQENVRASAALVRFTNEVYRVQVDKLQGGQAAPYEPMQLRALAVQARGALQQAKNRYESAWRQLAASLGTPDLPPQTLAGNPDDGLPELPYDAALAHIMGTHTDIHTAQNKEAQARIDLHRAEVVPIPDVGVYTAVQRDFTTPPVLRYTYNLQIGIPVPIFDRNRGGIQNAQAQLVRASEEAARVRNELTAQLADAYERYETNRVLVEYYRKQILPDQARAYRGVYERHQQEEEQVGFGDIVVAQQNLLTSITAYLSSLNSAWMAVTDIQGLMQRDINQGETDQTDGTLVPAPAAPEVPTSTMLREPHPAPGTVKNTPKDRTPVIKQVSATEFARQKSLVKRPESILNEFKDRRVSADKSE